MTSSFSSLHLSENHTQNKYPQSLEKTLHTQIKKKLNLNYSKYNLKTQQNYSEESQKEKTKLSLFHQGHNLNSKPKFYPSTYRPQHLKLLTNESQMIIVHLLYKQKNISIFLKKGVTFQEIIKNFYKEIYSYQKQTYSNSNIILKNLLNKITGFQSVENDLLFDYQFKYQKGTLNKQKIFVPFKQQDVKMPFKIYTTISQLPNQQGHQFLARNFSDGNWSILKTINKNSINQEMASHIKKSLKHNFSLCEKFNKSQSNFFSPINWFETKNYLVVLSQFFPQNLQENMKSNRNSYNEGEIEEIFIYVSKWLAQAFQNLVSLDIHDFVNLQLKEIVLDPYGSLKIKFKDFSEYKESNLHIEKQTKEKLSDIFYFDTYIKLLEEMRILCGKSHQNLTIFEQFLSFLTKKSNQNKFSFKLVSKYFELNYPSENQENNKLKRQKFSFKVDMMSKFQQIAQNFQNSKNNHIFANQQSNLISQIRQEIHEAYNFQNWRKNHPRNQTYTDVKVSSIGFGYLDFKRENIGNLIEFKKEEQRKCLIKTQQRIYIQNMINELNKNEKFIKITKQNNIASIGCYLKSNDQKLKKVITGKIQNKYKNFLKNNQNQSKQEFFRQTRNSHKSSHNFHQNKMSLSQNRSIQNFSFNSENKKLVSLIKRTPQRNQQNFNPDEQLSKQKIGQFYPKINGKEGLFDEKSCQSSGRNQLCRTTISFSKGKIDNLSPLINSKRQRLQELLVNKKDFTQKDKIALKKKHYGIYLEQAQNQFKKIKTLKKKSMPSNLK